MGTVTVEETGRTGRGIADSREIEEYLGTHGHPEIVEVLIADINGLFRGKWLPGAALDKLYGGGFAMPLSIFGLDVWGREVIETGLHLETGDKDGVGLPLAGTLRPVPWADRPTAQVLAGIWLDPDQPFFADPRHRLAAILERFRERGLFPVVAFETEFYLLPMPGPDAADPAGRAAEIPPPVHGERADPQWQNMYGLSDLSEHQALFEEIRTAAIAQGLPVSTFVSEAAPGQFEVNLAHRDDALAAADDAILLRRAISAVAAHHGYRATFMAKPYAERPGNGMHVHVSLLDEAGNNLFNRPDEGGTRLLEAIAGLVQTMPAALPLFISGWNGYRRLQPGSYAPTRATWGYNNRSVAIRVPAAEGEARRIEHRIGGADANPYLVLAGILAGMLHGLEHGLRPPQPIDGNAYDEPCLPLSRDMAEAICGFEHADFIRHAFGTAFRKLYADVKRAEIAAFEAEITPLERTTYL